MLNNFQLLIMIEEDKHICLKRVPLIQSLQDKLAQSWSDQYQKFIENIEEISFDAGYQLETHERFIIKDYILPKWLKNETSETIINTIDINVAKTSFKFMKSIIAFAQDENDNEIILFQNFSHKHVIYPGRFLLLKGNTYESISRPGITLDDKLSAVYFVTEKKLIFQNFRTTNTFLPLSDFYSEASEKEIRLILQHKLLAAEDIDILAVNANQWFRKRFSMLRDSGLLNNYTAQQIADHSNGYEVNIRIVDKKIIFPSDKNEAKKLLQFLNEEIFRGPITEKLYETNSKRETN